MGLDLAVSRQVPLVIVAKRHADDRGWFSETFHEKRLRDIGIHDRFVQDNQSYSKHRGTLRGLHFQVPPAAQAKLISVLHGRILDVAIDLRKGSPTYGKHVSAELSADSCHQLYIPDGFAHGFVALQDDVMVNYKVSAFYAPACDAGIRWNDRDIAFPWPVKEADAIISDKDKRLPYLKEFNSPFHYDGNPLGPLTVIDFGKL